MRVLVCGGRNYSDSSAVDSILDCAHRTAPISLLIAGGASGADSLAVSWARSFRAVPYHIEYAYWSKFGAAAGPMRNQKMLEMNPDVVIAFPGGKGTSDMIRKAMKKGVPVYQVPIEWQHHTLVEFLNENLKRNTDAEVQEHHPSAP